MNGYNAIESDIRTLLKPQKKILPNATDSLSLVSPKNWSSIFTPKTVDKVVDLDSVAFLLEVFSCITNQLYLVLSLFYFRYSTITK